ncbi:DUF1273 domain-containing protein [Robertmurraya andreesenii]|uniref:UPF0398 protein J2S07_001475 n=1 Tax=Anoxybacillus andreesenii TaxID=1325932 RepID=A0ABT9V2I9_9BACL|nr:DUF1273 domain-containing protein [Robertmurraya andreesenii]MDQ0155171.1 putative phage-like protein YoqJ [Robertmurraya andreesenii]
MSKVVVISGYKPHELGIFGMNHPSIFYIKTAIKKQIRSLLEDGLEWVVISGQLGTELWAAEVVFELQDEGHHELQLAVITPFLNQEENWNDEKKEWYESILMQADYVDSITKKPYEKPWQFRLRNQFLLEKSDGLILFYDSEREGSPKYLYESALNYQQQNDYQIYFIDFFDLQEIVEEEQIKKMDF